MLCVLLSSFGCSLLTWRLAVLHKHGLIHTDLKPENILLESTDSYIVPGKVRIPPALFLLNCSDAVHAEDQDEEDSQELRHPIDRFWKRDVREGVPRQRRLDSALPRTGDHPRCVFLSANRPG